MTMYVRKAQLINRIREQYGEVCEISETDNQLVLNAGGCTLEIKKEKVAAFDYSMVSVYTF